MFQNLQLNSNTLKIQGGIQKLLSIPFQRISELFENFWDL